MRHYISVFSVFLLALLLGSPAYAQLGVEDLAENMVDSSRDLPALASALAYLMGILFGVLGIFKILEHATMPETARPPLRKGIIRLLVGGFLFSLPLVFEAATNTISGGGAMTFDPTDNSSAMMNNVFGALGILSALASLGTNFDSILINIDIFTDDVPALVSALSYLLGIIMAISGVLRIKEHVDEPDQVKLKEPVIRLLTAGALFALPTVFRAMYTTITGGNLGIAGFLVSTFNIWSMLNSSETGGWLPDCATSLSATLGTVICRSMANTISLPMFLSGLSYLIGLAMGLWGILKIRDHVLSPMQTKLSEGVMRLLAAGAFFAMPFVGATLQISLTPVTLAGFTLAGTNTGFTTTTALSCGPNNSLEEAMGCLMTDIQGPLHVVLNYFCFVAGLILVMIGISRLIKSAQEGPRGPGGIGTVTTFVIAGLLMSANVILRAASETLFGSPFTNTTATLKYAGGMTAAETGATYHVINAVLRFMFIIGIISFVRGLFIIRGVAEGQQQSSIMVAMTHIIGGALAVNLGPLLNAIQNTLGITAFGVAFS
ncbi:MAG: hypothetical protein OEY94_03845 [Alphaproteobacteria bacterium]|nr:hypothetical protein [Alphaproteobacteria bacterium]